MPNDSKLLAEVRIRVTKVLLVPRASDVCTEAVIEWSISNICKSPCDCHCMQYLSCELFADMDLLTLTGRVVVPILPPAFSL